MTEIDVFLEKLQYEHAFRLEDIQVLKEHCFLEVLEGKCFYVTQNSICNRLGFVIEGVFKVSKTNNNGKEYIPYFVTPGHFAVDIHSYIHQQKSDENIIALTKSKVITITKESYSFLEGHVFNFSKIMNALKERALLEKLKLKNEMLIDDAETKYLKLLERQPNIFQIAPQSQIALHLGITQYTLSRIKSKK